MFLFIVMTCASTEDEKPVIIAHQRVKDIAAMKRCFIEFSSVQNIIFELVLKHKNATEKLNASTTSFNVRKSLTGEKSKNLVLDKSSFINFCEHQNYVLNNTIYKKKSKHQNSNIKDKKALAIKNRIEIYAQIIDAKVKKFHTKFKPDRNNLNKEWLDLLEATIKAYVKFKKSEIAFNIVRKQFYSFVDIFSKMNEKDKMKSNSMLYSRKDDFEKNKEYNEELEKIFLNLNSKLEYLAKFW